MRAAAIGVRTRAMAAAEAEGPTSKLRKVKGVELKKLRKDRRIVVAAARRRPISSPANSTGSERGGRISRCSSNASCNAMVQEPELLSGSVKSGGNSDTAVCYLECNRERRETTPSTSIGDLESTAEKKAAARPGTAVAMPAPSEIEEFFAAAESADKRRFTDKYNFDVERDIPLDGRYEWVRLEV